MHNSYLRSMARMIGVADLISEFKQYMFKCSRDSKLRRMGYLVNRNCAVVIPSLMRIDVVIPCVEKDIVTLPYVIDYARENIRHPLGRVYIISPESEAIRQVCVKKHCVFLHEDSVLPIRKSDIRYRVGNLDRAGWMYQQFLKLSGDLFCEQENYLVLDSDTLLIQSQVFEKDGRYLFNYSDEYHQPYFDAYERLFGCPAHCPVSLTSHHILVNTQLLQRMKSELHSRHGMPWYSAILCEIDMSEPSGHSDYDTYGQYVLGKARDSVVLEYWCNLSVPRSEMSRLVDIVDRSRGRYKSLSFHSYNVCKSC